MVATGQGGETALAALVVAAPVSLASERELGRGPGLEAPRLCSS